MACDPFGVSAVTDAIADLCVAHDLAYDRGEAEAWEWLDGVPLPVDDAVVPVWLVGARSRSRSRSRSGPLPLRSKSWSGSMSGSGSGSAGR